MCCVLELEEFTFFKQSENKCRDLVPEIWGTPGQLALSHPEWVTAWGWGSREKHSSGKDSNCEAGVTNLS